jgi:hypothetical protein
MNHHIATPRLDNTMREGPMTLLLVRVTAVLGYLRPNKTSDLNSHED